jgi:protein-glutamine gamma-glutamyltransferase
LAGVYFLITRRKSPEEKVLALFVRRMERRGYRKQPSQGLEEFVSHVADDRTRTCALRFVADFEQLYFKDRKFSREDATRLKGMAKSI